MHNVLLKHIMQDVNAYVATKETLTLNVAKVC